MIEAQARREAAGSAPQAAALTTLRTCWVEWFVESSWEVEHMDLAYTNWKALLRQRKVRP